MASFKFKGMLTFTIVVVVAHTPVALGTPQSTLAGTAGSAASQMKEKIFTGLTPCDSTGSCAKVFASGSEEEEGVGTTQAEAEGLRFFSLLQTGFGLQQKDGDAMLAHADTETHETARATQGQEAMQSEDPLSWWEQQMLTHIRSIYSGGMWIEIVFLVPLLFFILYVCVLTAMSRVHGDSSPPFRSLVVFGLILPSSYGLVRALDKAGCYKRLPWSPTMCALATATGCGVVFCVIVCLKVIAKKCPSASSPVVTKTKQPRLLSLDGIRVILIAVIMLWHAQPIFVDGNGVVMKAIDTFYGSVLGTSEPFFFIVSGFLTYHVTKQKVDQFDLGEGAAYVGRRLLRLAPAYQFALAMMLAQKVLQLKNIGFSRTAGIIPGYTWGEQLLGVEYVLQPLMVSALFPVRVCRDAEPVTYYGLGQGWFTSAISLAALCFPVMFNVVRSMGVPAKLISLLLCILLSVIAYVAHVFDPLFSHVYAGFHLYHVLIGMLCSSLSDSLHETLTRFSYWGFVLDAFLTCWIWTSRYHWWDPHQAALFAGCLICVVANGIALNAQTAKEESWYGRLLQTGIAGSLLSLSWLTWLADYSFSAYILAQPMQWIANCIFIAFGWSPYTAPKVGLPFWMAWAVGILVVPHFEAVFKSAVDRSVSSFLSLRSPPETKGEQPQAAENVCAAQKLLQAPP